MTLGGMFDSSAAAITRARRFIPGGVNSNYRLNISPTPLVIDKAEGPYLIDLDGNRLIDYYLGMGPMILGHSPQAVVDAVKTQLDRAILVGGQTEIEFEAAELLCASVPFVERVRFGSSGTEVIQAAIRLSRAATGRSAILKFEGHYHGWLDNMLWSVTPSRDVAGPEEAPTLIPGSNGIDADVAEALALSSWNRLDLLEQRLAQRDIAALIMEGAMCNTGAILPVDGFVQGVRELCSRYGTVFILDEVITGFRVGLSGVAGRLGFSPDLVIYGKAVANGFPVACVAGRADLMDSFDGPVMHGGTYNAQAVAMAATVATLSELRRPGFYDRLEKLGSKLRDGIADAFQKVGVPAVVTGFPQIFHVGMGLSKPPINYRDLMQIDRARYIQFTTKLLGNGVRALERGAWFISSMHDEAIIEETLVRVRQTLAEL